MQRARFTAPGFATVLAAIQEAGGELQSKQCSTDPRNVAEPRWLRTRLLHNHLLVSEWPSTWTGSAGTASDAQAVSETCESAKTDMISVVAYRPPHAPVTARLWQWVGIITPTATATALWNAHVDISHCVDTLVLVRLLVDSNSHLFL